MAVHLIFCRIIVEVVRPLPSPRSAPPPPPAAAAAARRKGPLCLAFCKISHLPPLCVYVYVCASTTTIAAATTTAAATTAAAITSLSSFSPSSSPPPSPPPSRSSSTSSWLSYGVSSEMYTRRRTRVHLTGAQKTESTTIPTRYLSRFKPSRVSKSALLEKSNVFEKKYSR